MTTRRLNVFQRLARTWDAVHPYNAGQVCCVAKTFPRERIDKAWESAIRPLTLGTSAVQHLDEEKDLSRHLTREINRTFDDCPFRPFTLAARGKTWFGVVYQHWVADSFSIRWLMREWLARLLDLACVQPNDVRFSRASPRGNRLDAIGILFRQFCDFRRTRKVATFGPHDCPTRVQLLPDAGTIVPGLLQYARSQNVKFNDVLLAALAEALHPLLPAQARKQRKNIAISSIVDLRPMVAPPERHDFGCLLGFHAAICRPSELCDWDRMLRVIAAQTRAQRRAGATGTEWMTAAEFAAKVTPPPRIYGFYRKEAPYAGGVSNVNLNRTWFGRQHPQLIEQYIRVSPTGPLVPLALNVTTLGDELAMSMTYRSGLLNDWTAVEIAQAVTRRLKRVAAELRSA